LIFRNFGASGTIALATYYEILILVRKSILKDIKKTQTEKTDLKSKRLISSKFN